jgi:polysaccharide biosynthesis/export protein
MKIMQSDWIITVPFALVLATATAVCTAQTAPGLETASPLTTPSTSSSTPASAPQFQSRDQRYEIEPGDSFDITFDFSPEFNQVGIAVQPDGFVTLHGVGDLKVQGETVPELTDTLRQAYMKILHDPVISVVLKDFQKPYFIADGQVLRPGKYELRSKTTLIEAIAMAGGFTDASQHSHVQLYRRVKDGWVFAQIINVKKMHSEGMLTEDPYLHPGDMLFVPKNRYSKIKPFLPSSGVGISAYNSSY